MFENHPGFEEAPIWSISEVRVDYGHQRINRGVSCNAKCRPTGRSVLVYRVERKCSPRHCLHGRGFICNRIGFDAVTPFVNTAPVEFVIRTVSIVLNTLSKVERFQYDTVSRSCKRRNRIDLKTVWSEIGWLAK